MTGSGPVSLCACVSECELWPHWSKPRVGVMGWRDGPGHGRSRCSSSSSSPAPCRLSQQHTGRRGAICQSFIWFQRYWIYQSSRMRKEIDPLYGHFSKLDPSWYWSDVVCHYRWQKHCKSRLISSENGTVMWLQARPSEGGGGRWDFVLSPQSLSGFSSLAGPRLPPRLTKHLPGIHQRSHPSVHQVGSPLAHQQVMLDGLGWLPDNER